jgi:UV DNA damage endonuclease
MKVVPATLMPNLGLVCQTKSPDVRYRMTTLTRFSALEADAQTEMLRGLYRDNLSSFRKAIAFCLSRNIKLYRMPSTIFPFSDMDIGREVLHEFESELANAGLEAIDRGVRIVAHPDQFVVLSSDSEKVNQNSVVVLEMHAMIFDMLKQPRTAWNAITLHGGKRGNSHVLLNSIEKLSEGVRNRLVLENDELAYSSEDILQVCKASGVPMIFDAHHHLVKEKSENYDCPSIGHYVDASRETWAPNQSWQLVHISNGAEHPHDRRHSDIVTEMPSSYARVPWIEVEAKAKEEAVAFIQTNWLSKLNH